MVREDLASRRGGIREVTLHAPLSIELGAGSGLWQEADEGLPHSLSRPHPYVYPLMPSSNLLYVPFFLAGAVASTLSFLDNSTHPLSSASELWGNPSGR